LGARGDKWGPGGSKRGPCIKRQRPEKFQSRANSYRGKGGGAGRKYVVSEGEDLGGQTREGIKAKIQSQDPQRHTAWRRAGGHVLQWRIKRDNVHLGLRKNNEVPW